MTAIKYLTLGVAAGVLCACGGGEQPPVPEPVKAVSAPPVKKDTRPAIVIFGDSLSAGFGLEAGQSYPDYLQKLMDARGLQFQVINLGLSGDTSTGGVSRLDECLALKPRVVVLELGGNDGLRGIAPSITRSNLAGMIERMQSSGTQVVLAGMTLPRNYGKDYIREFDRIYPELAKQYKLTLIPFLLEGLASPKGIVPGMIQPDGIHPTAKGTPVIAATVFRKLEPLLQ
jgi:acyl-CoA thioesterase I